MKFGKRLKQQVEQTLPQWRDKFLSYKDLKKLISSATVREADFVYLLNKQVDKLNAFFIEQEEDFIIRHLDLQQMVQRVIDIWGPNGSSPSNPNYKEQMGKIRKDIVDFHGEMVLLANYSIINYTGLVKILKKYDKRKGGLLRLPFIQKVLQQPFFTTDPIHKLVKEFENTLDYVFPVEEDRIEQENEAISVGNRIYSVFPVEDERRKQENEAISIGDGIFRSTVAALVTMQEIRRASSTYNHFSLPPLDFPESDLIRTLQPNSPTI